MSAAQKATEPVGSVVKVKANETVTRPDGRQVDVSDGLYVLDVPGVHTVGDKEVEAK